MTNRCRANPNTSRFPIKWEIWRGVWICSTPICHKVLEVMGDESILVYSGIICFQRVGAFRHHMHSEGGCIWRYMQQRVILHPCGHFCYPPLIYMSKHSSIYHNTFLIFRLIFSFTLVGKKGTFDQSTKAL